MKWIWRHWRTLLGVGAYIEPIWRGLRWVVGRGGDLDFIITRTSEPGWIGTIINWLLDPPGWITLPLVVIGTLLIWWDLKRQKGVVARDNQKEKKEGEIIYVADPEAEALDKPAYNQLVAFCIDHLLPACGAQVELQEALVRHLCNNEMVAALAIDGLRHDWKLKTRGFWENYANLSSGLTDSPGPSIKFDGMIECIHELEREFYKNFCDKAVEIGKSAGLDLEKSAVSADRSRWLFHHNAMTAAYAAIARDIRFGKLHRLRPARWGSY